MKPKRLTLKEQVKKLQEEVEALKAKTIFFPLAPQPYYYPVPYYVYPPIYHQTLPYQYPYWWGNQPMCGGASFGQAMGGMQSIGLGASLTSGNSFGGNCQNTMGVLNATL